MMKRTGLTIVAIALGLAVLADAAQGTARFSGIARDAQGQALPGVKVQLRNVDTGQLVATTKAAPDGAFEFTGLLPGNYVAELVDDSGQIIGLSPSTALAAGGAVSGLVVTASASGALAGAAAAGGLGAFFTSTAGILLLVGIGAGVTAAIIVAANDASPSR
jgi:Carboxypeptidase regulatory-like domain